MFDNSLCSRRDIMRLGALGAIACGCSSLRAQSNSGGGCFASLVSALTGPVPINLLQSSGYDGIDEQFEEEIPRLVATFGVRPAFSFFNEPAIIGPNAYATTENLLNSRDGTVLFGKKFIESRFYYDDGEWNELIYFHLRSVLAHEYAHIFQAQLQSPLRMPTPWRELQADFLASWHMSKFVPSQFSIIGLFHELGDTDFMNVDHHGTPAQRISMSSQGYFFGKRNPRARASDAADWAASRLLLNRSGGVDVID